MNKSRIWLIVSGVTILLVVLFAWPRLNDPNRELKKAWAQAEVDCLSSHTQAGQHIHSHLTIMMDGQEGKVVDGIGLVSTCMAELHTHGGDGVIHIESVYAGKQFTLGNFFTISGEPFYKDGYELTMTVDGQPSEEMENLVLKDEQEITLNYQQLTTDH